MSDGLTTDNNMSYVFYRLANQCCYAHGYDGCRNSTKGGERRGQERYRVRHMEHVAASNTGCHYSKKRDSKRGRQSTL